MPVTLEVNSHPSQPIPPHLLNPTQTATDALCRTAPKVAKPLRHLLHTSLPAPTLCTLVTAENGLLHACIQAYNHHHHLHIRPDDVWITILTQFNAYVNAHAEELREWFVQHEGKKSLELVMPEKTRFGADYGWMAERFVELMEKELVPGHGLQDWMLPRFSTTTKTDTAVEAGLMMCTLQAYFKFTVHYLCGLPSVTLLGTKEDWVILRQRIDKLLEFGHKELTEWHGLLAPVLDRFVDMFEATEEKDKQKLRDFWNVMCKIIRVGSGSDGLTGWLWYLCPFTNKGEWQLGAASTIEPVPPTLPQPLPNDSDSSANSFRIHSLSRDQNMLQFEWQRYEHLCQGYNEFKAFSEIVCGTGKMCRWRATHDLGAITLATAHVDVKIDDNGHWVDGILVTGMAGYEVHGNNQDTLKPVPGWWMFEVDEVKKALIKEHEEWEEE